MPPLPTHPCPNCSIHVLCASQLEAWARKRHSKPRTAVSTAIPPRIITIPRPILSTGIFKCRINTNFTRRRSASTVHDINCIGQLGRDAAACLNETVEADLVASVVVELYEIGCFVNHDELTVPGALAFAVGEVAEGGQGEEEGGEEDGEVRELGGVVSHVSCDDICMIVGCQGGSDILSWLWSVCG